MNQKKQNMALEISTGWLFDLILITFLLFLLSIPLGFAAENKAPIEESRQTQPTVHAPANPEAMSFVEQVLEAQLPKSSVDFLMERSPALSQAPTVAMPETMPAPIPSPVTLKVLQGIVVAEADEVAMLVSEQCSQSGDVAESTNSCKRVYSNGHHATVLTQNANEGDEFKRQTVIEEFDGNETLLYRKTIRHRVDYNYLNDEKAKEKEFFDIIYQPAGKKTTRELMVYEYFLDTGKARSLSWTQYKQIASEPKAELVYHALLRYGNDGSPDRGLAERWDHGQKADTFINWSRGSKGFATLDHETWREWEGWIRNVSLQAYLP